MRYGVEVKETVPSNIYYPDYWENIRQICVVFAVRRLDKQQVFTQSQYLDTLRRASWEDTP